MGILVLGERLWKPREERDPRRPGQGRGVGEVGRRQVDGEGGREIESRHGTGDTGAHRDVPIRIAVRWWTVVGERGRRHQEVSQGWA